MRMPAIIPKVKICEASCLGLPRVDSIVETEASRVFGKVAGIGYIVLLCKKFDGSVRI